MKRKEFDELAALVAGLGNQIAIISSVCISLETILEHHGLLTEEHMKAIGPKIRAKLAAHGSLKATPEAGS